MITLVPEDMKGLFSKIHDAPRENSIYKNVQVTTFLGGMIQMAKINSLQPEYCCYGNESIPCFPPLDHAEFFINSNGSEYNINLNIFVRNNFHRNKCLEDDANESKRIGKIFNRSRKNMFIPDKDQVVVGDGILFQYDKLDKQAMFYLAYILNPGEKNSVANLTCGEGSGMKRRLLTSYEQFEADFGHFCEIGSAVINSFYKKEKAPKLELRVPMSVKGA